MHDANVYHLMEKATGLVHFAESELSRAQEDVVTFLACHHIKKGIDHYLRAFIESYGVLPPADVAPENLLQLCISIDPNFEALNFKCLDCSCEKGADNFCLEVDHVQDCLHLAHHTKSMVIDRIDI